MALAILKFILNSENLFASRIVHEKQWKKNMSLILRLVLWHSEAAYSSINVHSQDTIKFAERAIHRYAA